MPKLTEPIDEEFLSSTAPSSAPSASSLPNLLPSGTVEADASEDLQIAEQLESEGQKEKGKEEAEEASASGSPSALPDSSALEDSAIDSFEEQSALAKAVPEVRDASLSRFSKRFRFTNRYVKLAKYESDNETFYPRDHVRDGQLWNARKRMIDGERQTLRQLSSDFKPLLPLYQNFSAYLQENPADGIITEKQWAKLSSLTGLAQSHYRRSLDAKLNRELNRRYRADSKRRSKLLQRLVRKEGPVCDGCKLPTPLPLPLRGGRSLILRKFVGNREEFTIYNATFCRRARRR